MEDFTLVRTNLSQQVAEHLEEVILSSKLSKIDEKLPSELALSRQYNVSRPVIREALKLLQERGLVVMKNGDGSYVTKPETDTIMQAVNRIMQMGNISSDDLAQVRSMLEISSAQLAAKNATDAQLLEIEAIADSMKDASLSLKQRVEKDSAFHIGIARASGNKLLETFLQVIAPLLPDYMGKGVLLPGGIEDGVHRHSLLVEALKSHSPEKAAKAMGEHLAASRDNVREFDSRLSRKPRS
ncbi:transcriptional regulator [Sphaerochaeta pleomorpha str. Grapes]|uniref:Pyruvate dehydrogenase complex repressor n=1 Tax=Sphaerochaeta pleomorpha (strain ATCC BAA-1885 / DSM 22778 / Grapes) TaxID=158190 RepID=G8QV89_SPHPG|nr:FadR/GntR family transcriptional regulator [Sphaerochaeta pleomorpha]AEV30404.1 transcriptional regulator [Sphaerochaeta pleomorpha str. Grapes]